MMSVSRIAFAVLGTFSLVTHSEVIVETSCYFSQTRTAPPKITKLTLQTYFDKDISQQIGAFVRYDQSRKIIQLVFSSSTTASVEDAALGNFEMRWLEISAGKPTGWYSLIQTGAGNKQGRYVLYTSLRNRRSVSFQKFGDGEDCAL